jgi:hypothetical protein
VPKMDIERLPTSLLNGSCLHCQPVEGGPIVEAPIVQSEDGSTPTFRVVIVCPVRLPMSKCVIRKKAGIGEGNCLWYKGDSKGEYQIIGPGMDKKSDRGCKQEKC